MSGHSKWAQIKRQKGVADIKRGNLFTKLANTITVAAKEGGGDPEMNFKLRIAVDKAKQANMPSDNIERAVQRGTGELEGAHIEEVIYEGFGPEGIALVIEAVTDNRNRTAAEIRKILEKHQGNLGQSGSVLWNFEKKGVLRIAQENIKNKEDFELKIIEQGAEDMAEEKEGLTIFSKPDELDKIKKFFQKNNIPLESAEVELVAKNRKKIADKNLVDKLNSLFIELEAHDSINNYYSDAEI